MHLHSGHLLPLDDLFTYPSLEHLLHSEEHSYIILSLNQLTYLVQIRLVFFIVHHLLIVSLDFLKLLIELFDVLSQLIVLVGLVCHLESDLAL